MIPEGTIKPVVTLGEAPQTVTTVIDFLMVNYSSTYNGVLGRLLLRTLKAITSIHCLTMKFLLVENSFVTEDLAGVYDKNCINRHVVLFLKINNKKHK